MILDYKRCTFHHKPSIISVLDTK